MKKVILAGLVVFASIVIFSIVLFLVNKDSGKGALQVTAQPQSRVYLDGKLIGKTPLCKCDDLKDMISTGEYKVRVVPEEEGFDPFESKITISPKVLTVVDRTFNKNSQSSAFIINLKKLSDKNNLELQVISLPQNSQVFLDNNAVGFTPVTLKNITESDHEIKITKEGYQDKIIRIRTVKGFKLEALAFLGINPAAVGESDEPSTSTKVSKVVILQTPTGFLRVRESASTAASEIGRVSPGEKYDLVSEEEGWFEIKFEGETGWISAQYAEKED